MLLRAVLMSTAWVLSCSALLDDPMVSFNKTSPLAIPLHSATIVHAADDAVGVWIAANSLIEDFEAITGVRPPSYAVNGSEWDLAPGDATQNVILIATANSAVTQELSGRGLLDTSDIDGKWEVFKTAAISNTSIPGVENIFAIIGSDKRGAIFGTYNLAEQCGQSP